MMWILWTAFGWLVLSVLLGLVVGRAIARSSPSTEAPTHAPRAGPDPAAAPPDRTIVLRHIRLHPGGYF
jgi:hypothetical protein